MRNAGVARWKRDTDRFEVFQHVAGSPDTLASNAARTLLIDRQGRLWIGFSDAGVDILDPGNGSIRHLRHDANSDASLSSDQVWTLREGKGGDVWIGTQSGLDRWHATTGRVSVVSASAMRRCCAPRCRRYWRTPTARCG